MRRPNSASTDKLQELADRVTFLETYKQVDADVVKQASEQIEALTTAIESIAARLRLLLIWCAVLTVVFFGLTVIVVMR